MNIHQAVRKNTIPVNVDHIIIGGGSDVVIQSMTSMDTADIKATAAQIIELVNAGSEIVRITVNNEEAAAAVPYIKEIVVNAGYNTPIVGCFHYNGHHLLTKFPECAKAISKYRINPGNVGFGYKRDKQFETIVECAIRYEKPIRIGVNWGSLDQELTSKLMDQNANSIIPKTSTEIIHEAIVTSAITSAEKAMKIGLPNNMIVLSAKVSQVQDVIKIYKALSARSDHALHVGLTEAGSGIKGIIATTAALSALLLDGIGDTIRASLTPKPGELRTCEVSVCKDILQSLGLRFFTPQVSSCPGCGRTNSTYFQQLTEEIQDFLAKSMPQWHALYPGVEQLRVAVMGCIVNGPGESKHADIGITLPGNGEATVAPVFIDGKKAYILKGKNIANEFKVIICNYVAEKFKI